MKYEKNRQIFGIDEYKAMKMAKVLIFPAIALVLVLIIVLMNKSGGEKEADQTSQTAVQAAASQDAQTTGSIDISPSQDGSTGESDDSIVKIGETSAQSGESIAQDGGGSDASGADASGDTYINDFTDYGLKNGAPSGVTQLIESYQRARLDADAAAMYKLFGRLDTDGLEQLQANLDEEKKVFEAYQDTTYYSTEGVEADSYLVYVSTNVKFHGIDTTAPMLIWAYCVKGADDTYYMKEPDKLTDEEQALLDAVSASEDVRVLDNSMRTELAKAVVSDPKLAALYEIWAQGDD